MSISQFSFFGEAFFSGFYLNELILRLCPVEVEMPQSFVQYHQTLQQLQQLTQQAHPDVFLRQILRQFEHALLEELGYALDFTVDAQQHKIQELHAYLFQLNEGFIPTDQQSRSTLSGRQILSMCDYEKGRDFNHEQLQLLTKLYRQIISALLGDRPLKSRQLWIQNTQSQS